MHKGGAAVVRNFKRITVWENRRRLAALTRYREDLVEYFNGSSVEYLGTEPEETEAACAARTRINRETHEILGIFMAAGTAAMATWTPPPAIGGRVQTVDMVQNVFNLATYELPPNWLLDAVDRVIGLHESNDRPALLRTLNPFFYVGLAFDWLSRAPFSLATSAGFNGAKLEDSITGRIIRALIYCIEAFASLLTILYLLGYLPAFRAFLKARFGI